MRQSMMPMGKISVTSSAVVKKLSRFRFAYAHMAKTTPMTPPWKLIPPFHVCGISSGCAK